MRDLGQALLAKTETIINDWIEAVRQDVEIESAKGLTYKSVRNSLPHVLKALATLLTQSIEDQPQKLENESLEHGSVRAEQGYDVTEIVREYRLLRQMIFSALEPELLSGSSQELLRAIRAIDSVFDEVISLSLENYVEARLQELEQVQSQLLLTNQELTRLVASQKDNVSYLAHELKNPLNAIMGFSELLRQQQQKLAQGKDTSLNLQMIEQVLQNGRQLLRLINDVLEISRYEADQIKLNIEPTDIRSLIQNIVNTLEPLAREKNLEVIVDCDRAPEQVLSDPLKLRQILTNLASNALRYTDAGIIRIVCQLHEHDKWLLTVADTGRGISPEAQAQIFEPYFRVGSEEDYLPESSGLGLAIVAKLVKLLQGSIELESQVGEGSTFTVILPLAIKNLEQNP